MDNNQDIQEILKKVREVEIRAKGLTDHIFAGEYHTTFKGRGMSFSEVREYQYGDEVRSIDWNVTARYDTPYIKVFEEERELNMMLLVDISMSEVFGSKHQSKRELITDIAAMLSYSALRNSDKIGAIFFTDKVESYIPPKKGKRHALHIIREVLTSRPEGQHGSDLRSALEFVQKIQKKKTICFILSDFILEDFSTEIAMMSKRHDMIGVHIWDKYDRELPDLGLMKVQDPETETELWVDTKDKSTRNSYTESFDKTQARTHQIFRRYGLDMIDIRTDMDYVAKFQNFFKNRMRHR